MSFPAVRTLTDQQSLYLDVLRVVAAQAVLAVHIMEWAVVPMAPVGSYDFILPLGYLAVMCFFALSGLLIARSIVMSAARPCGYDFKLYMVHRLARLWPTLLTALAVSAASYLAIEGLGLFGSEGYVVAGSEAHFPRTDAHLKPSTMVATGLFMNGMIGIGGFSVGTIGMNGPLWSLAHEFWFYLVAGLFANWFYGKSRVSAGIAIAILAWQAITGNERWLFGLVIWLAGAFLVTRGKERSTGGAAGYLLSGAGLAAVVWAALNPPADGFTIMDRSLMGAAALLIVSGGLRMPMRLPQSSAPLCAIFAGYTFTLYAIHWPLIQLFMGIVGPDFRTWSRPAAALTLVGLAATINLVAFALSRFCEDTPRWRKLLLPLFSSNKT